jgi:hypothetical protein
LEDYSFVGGLMRTRIVVILHSPKLGFKTNRDLSLIELTAVSISLEMRGPPGGHRQMNGKTQVCMDEDKYQDMI